MCILDQCSLRIYVLFLYFYALHHYKDQRTFLSSRFIFDWFSLPILCHDIIVQILKNCYFTMYEHIGVENQEGHHQ